MAGRKSGDEEDPRIAGGLRNPYPSPPFRLPTHGIKIECQGRRFITNFSACYAAKHFVNLVIDGEEYKRISPTRIKTSGKVYVDSPELEEILRYKPTPEEKRWDIPGHYRWQAFYVATGRRLNLKRSPSYKLEPYSQEIRRFLLSTGESLRESQENLSPPESRRSRSLVPPVRVGDQRTDRRPEGKSQNDKISLADICTEIGMETSRARRILRSRSDLSHTRSGRWEWDERDALEIKRILQRTK